jgi:ABC-type glutathione transport system ATPase component
VSEISPLVEVADLHVAYENGTRAVDGVSFEIYPGEALGLVGESGSGKSSVARAILGFREATSGTIRYSGASLSQLSRGALRRQRRSMQVVFQDPYSSLNPRKRIEQILSFPLKIHGVRGDRSARVRELLDLVGLDDSHLRRFPHQLSGGQCQRVAIARALALEPSFVILDEAVSSLSSPDLGPLARSARAPCPDVPLHFTRPGGGAVPLSANRSYAQGTDRRNVCCA